MEPTEAELPSGGMGGLRQALCTAPGFSKHSLETFLLEGRPGEGDFGSSWKEELEVWHAPHEVLGSRLLEGYMRQLDEHAEKFVNPSGVELWKKMNSIFLPSAWNLDSRLVIELFRSLIMCKLCRWNISMTPGYTRNWPQSLTAEPQLCFCRENLCS